MDVPGDDRPDARTDDSSIIDLIGRLASDGVRLLKEEGQLATLQLRELLLSTLWGTVRLTVPLALAALALVLLVVGMVAWLVARLGSLWAGALSAGGGLLVVALVLLWWAARSFGRPAAESDAAATDASGARADDADDGPRLVTDAASTSR